MKLFRAVQSGERLNERLPLEVQRLRVCYQERPVLENVTFSVPPGKITGIIGPNGAGKTTLIKAIMGLLPVTNGAIQFFGMGLDQVRRKISYVPQRETVDWNFPASVFEIVLMGRYPHTGMFGRLTRKDKMLAERAMDLAGIRDLATRQLAQLSGGQQQRVFIARSLAQDASLYLMDEPFAGVDAASETAILELLNQMKASGKTIVLVHHDLYTAAAFFDNFLLLNKGVIAFGPGREVFTSANLEATYGKRLSAFSRVVETMWQQNGNLYQ